MNLENIHLVLSSGENQPSSLANMLGLGILAPKSQPFVLRFTNHMFVVCLCCKPYFYVFRHCLKTLVAWGNYKLSIWLNFTDVFDAIAMLWVIACAFCLRILLECIDRRLNLQT